MLFKLIHSRYEIAEGSLNDNKNVYGIPTIAKGPKQAGDTYIGLIVWRESFLWSERGLFIHVAEVPNKKTNYKQVHISIWRLLKV